MQVLPCFGFEGNAREAMKLYEKAFDGNVIFTMLYKENKEVMKDYPEYENKIFHAEMKIGDGYLYISDLMPEITRMTGNNVDVHINFYFNNQLENAFNILKDGGVVKSELNDTFWGARYASVIDKFGNSWSLNHQYSKDEN